MDSSETSGCLYCMCITETHNVRFCVQLRWLQICTELDMIDQTQDKQRQFCLNFPVLLSLCEFNYRECCSHGILLLCLFRSKVHALCYVPHAKKLVSCSEDGIVRIWDMNVKRQEVHNQQAGRLAACLSVCLSASEAVS